MYMFLYWCVIFLILLYLHAVYVGICHVYLKVKATIIHCPNGACLRMKSVSQCLCVCMCVCKWTFICV